MAQTFARLTLYAFLSAIEEDLRDAIALHLTGQGPDRDILGAEVYDRAALRFGNDTGLPDGDASLDQLLSYIDFADLFHILNRHRSLLPHRIAAYIKEVTFQLERLVLIRNRVMHSRPLDFEDLPVTHDIVESLLSGDPSIWPSLLATATAVSNEPSVVLGYHLPLVGDQAEAFNNLPLPDFDETGFIGRKKTVAQVIKACLGPYPVVTVVGEGGIGKTALALKVAYDILDSDECPFEAVVWTTSKTTQLGPQEIRRVEDAISTSVGVLSNVARQIAGAPGDDPVGEVLEQLRDFRVLLILDNLETVFDERIRAFLSELPTGSKVLITSRIGIGAFEYPVKLTPLEDGEAVQLLRAVARARNVEHLTRTKNDNLAAYCRRMRNNPLHIKWFVSAVQAGRRPEDVLANDKLLLEFCMSNVYEYLTEHSRAVLDALLGLGGTYSLAELSFITELPDLDLQRAVQQLATTNMLGVVTQPTAFSYETKYELSGLSRAYLKQLRKVPDDLTKTYSRRKQQLIAAGEEIRSGSSGATGRRGGLLIRSRSDWVVAKHLLAALQQSAQRDFAAAEDLILRAKNLAPNYFEVFRAEAQVQAAQQNVVEATTAYEAAIELEPHSHFLLTELGAFLLRQADDTLAAIPHLQQAVQLGGGIHPSLELARAYLFNRDFDAACPLIQTLAERTDLNERQRKIVIDLRMQYLMRMADYRTTQGQYAKAIEDLRNLRKFYATITPDRLMRQKMRKALVTAQRAAALAENEADQREALELLHWLSNESAQAEPAIDAPAGAHLSGVIDELPLTEKYGFVVADDGPRLFFHRMALVEPDDWGTLKVGIRVDFDVGTNPSGPCAVNVRINPASSTSVSPALSLGEFGTGIVLRIREDRSFGFLRADNGPEFYFHRAAVQPKDAWDRLQVGDQVRFTLSTDAIGRTRANKVIKISRM